jgi:hypothetical protein
MVKSAALENPTYYKAHMSAVLKLIGLSDADYAEIELAAASLREHILTDMPFLDRCDLFGSVSRRAALRRPINPHSDIDIIMSSNFSEKYLYPSELNDFEPVDFSDAPKNEVVAWNIYHPDPQSDGGFLEVFVKRFKDAGFDIQYDLPCATIEYCGHRFDIVFAEADLGDDCFLIPIRREQIFAASEFFNDSRYSSQSVTGSSPERGLSNYHYVVSWPWHFAGVRESWISQTGPDPSKALVLIKYVFLANGIELPSFFIETDLYNGICELDYTTGVTIFDIVVMFFADTGLHYPKLYHRLPNFNKARKYALQYLKNRDKGRHDLAISCLLNFCPPPDVDPDIDRQGWERELREYL